MDGAPLNYLTSAGTRAAQIAWLTWGLLIISVIVIAVIAYLLLAGINRRQPRVAADGGPPVETIGQPGFERARRPESALQWIYVGVGVSTVVLFLSAVWTMYTLAAVSAPAQAADLTVAIKAHQWWWEATYLSKSPSEIFTTADEIHIPVGKPVRFLLNSPDVIHSFWVPALAGKTDVIPGQTNETWLQADKAGTYLGQCTEYCGKEHAKMGLRVIAQTPDQFEAWRKHQLVATPSPPANSEAAEGETLFSARCGGCHRIRGTLAGGVLGPDLTHLMTRHTLASGSLPNTPAHLSVWIIEPQSIKPGTQMPAVDLSSPELEAIRNFLETLG